MNSKYPQVCTSCLSSKDKDVDFDAKKTVEYKINKSEGQLTSFILMVKELIIKILH